MLALPYACFYFEIFQAKRVLEVSVRSVFRTWKFWKWRGKAEHVFDNMLDVAGTIYDVMGEMNYLTGTWIINGTTSE